MYRYNITSQSSEQKSPFKIETHRVNMPSSFSRQTFRFDLQFCPRQIHIAHIRVHTHPFGGSVPSTDRVTVCLKIGLPTETESQVRTRTRGRVPNQLRRTGRLRGRRMTEDSIFTHRTTTTTTTIHNHYVRVWHWRDYACAEHPRETTFRTNGQYVPFFCDGRRLAWLAWARVDAVEPLLR